MTTAPAYNVCCLQSGVPSVSHNWKMSPSNLLVIALILTAVHPVISTYPYGGIMFPGMCFRDPWSCIRYIMYQSIGVHRLYANYCRIGCERRGLRTSLCARIRDRCYTCKCIAKYPVM